MQLPGLIPDRVPIYISWVRNDPKIIIPLITNFLEKCGKVYAHGPVKDKRGVETFEHVFWLNEDDVLNNPPKSYVYMGRKKLRVKYKGQIPTCYQCDSTYHVVSDCPYKKTRVTSDTQAQEVQIPDSYNQHFPPLNRAPSPTDTMDTKAKDTEVDIIQTEEGDDGNGMEMESKAGNNHVLPRDNTAATTGASGSGLLSEAGNLSQDRIKRKAQDSPRTSKLIEDATKKNRGGNLLGLGEQFVNQAQEAQVAAVRSGATPAVPPHKPPDDADK